MSEAFIIPPHLVAVTDSASSDAIVEPGDSTNRAVRVNIVAGGSAGVTHTDDAPFTPAVDDGVPIFGFFDDVVPDSVDEGDAGAVRMSGNRNLYMRVRDNAGNERGANVTAASELNVIATAQPGVDVGDVTVNNAGGAAAVNIQDGGNIITVDGAVTVSGTVTSNQGTPAATASKWPVQITDGTDLALVTAAGEVNTLATAQPGVDIGDVTINNAGAAAAVNIQDGGNSITVDGSVSISGSVDTELPAAAALADNAANPTVPGVGSFLMGFDGTNWDRVRADGGSVFIQDGGNSITVDTTQLPVALVGGRLDENVGAWLGSTAPTVGQKTMANSIPVAIASDQSAVTVVGAKSNNGGVPGATNLGTLPAVATAAAPSYTEGNQVALSLDLAGALRTAGAAGGGLTDAQLRAFAAVLGVTATAAVGVAVTLTLPAAGAGQFHYISNIEITADTAPVALAANASAVVTSTNLNGSPAWNVKVERNGGGVNSMIRNTVIPLRSAVANTATTIVAPATTNVIWRLNVEYFTGP